MPLFLTALVLCISMIPAGAADAATDKEAVRQAVLDYVEAVYLAQPERIDRSIHTELAKRGFYRAPKTSEYKESKMAFERLRWLAENWSKNLKVPVDKLPKEIVVFDVLDMTAAAKLSADWGTDYFHLAKYDGKWKVVHVLWQSYPRDK